ncbi:MAG TPA: DUF1343 domain-containing protein [Hyphomicrobiaceae bacterium]|jgi:uncharacterized protein YbbC (DUF1343 family)
MGSAPAFPGAQDLALYVVKLVAVAGMVAMAHVSSSQSAVPGGIVTGAEVLARSGFAALAGKRVGLITNQTGRVGAEHLADLLATAPNLKLAAILAPEHGFRGEVEAGAGVGDAVDAKTGVPVFSLYGATKKPTPAMLRGVDALVFDIQDIGTRYYTYISTMGLAMQAAAEAHIPFLVLDRPNPLGGDYVSGFVRERELSTLVGQYPIPIVHGLTVGELARMIKGERWLPGLDALDLAVIPLEGWRRSLRWPELQLPWVATSPNIPSFEAALVYPGMGIVGEVKVNEGRGTPTPFSLFGAPWLDAGRPAGTLNALALPGVRFEPSDFTPRSIPGVALHPRFEGQHIPGVRIAVTDAASFEPLETGVHVLAALFAEARAGSIAEPVANMAMFNALAGTRRLYRMLAGGSSGAEIVAAWRDEVARFRAQRARYLLY